MNKKVIIQIIIIVGAFAGAGFVLYNGFNQGAGSSTSVIGTPVANENEKILPFGFTPSFDTNLEKRGFQFGTMSYPAVERKDIGIVPDSALIAPSRMQK
ncbi:MAG: hypothetical protein WC794_04305 [Candidatus Doudnabacteria bacterium]|jgi:hypothetical protein